LKTFPNIYQFPLENLNKSQTLSSTSNLGEQQPPGTKKGS